MRNHLRLSLFGTSTALIAGSLLVSSAAHGQRAIRFTEPSGGASYLLTSSSAYSSSSFSHTDAFVDAPEPASLNDKLFGGGITRPPVAYVPTMRPFSAVAVSVKVGSGGIGFDVATPLAKRFNLRSGASFFSYNTNLVEDGLHIAGDIQFQNASASLDYYPFNNSFRISPGLTFHNNNALNAAITVPGGQSFSLGDGDYVSNPIDPIHGTAAFVLGKGNFAPRLTMGFGNMLPRNNSRFSVPFEIGFQYVAQPTVRLNFAGSACGTQVQDDGSEGAGCGVVNPADVAQEQHDLQSDLSALRFYPIVSIGVSYRIGRIHRGE